MTAAPRVPWATKTGRSSEPDPVTPEVRATVRARAHGRCELCGASGTAVHHRKLRRHGDHSVPNLVLLCATCHSRVHTRGRWSYETGWLLRAHQDPAAERLAYDGRWQVLLNDGGLREVAA